MEPGIESGAGIAADGPDPPAGNSDHEATGEGSRQISALILARIFFQIGATSFGGLGPSLSIIERELVDKRPILTAVEVAEAVAATRLLPGSTLVQVASFLGYRIRGWTGSAVATAACILPPATAMIGLAVFMETLPSASAFGSAAQGLAAAVVGMLLVAMCRFGQATMRDPVSMGLGLCAFGSAAVLGVPAAVVVVAAGLIGMLLLSKSESDRGSGPGRGGRS